MDLMEFLDRTTYRNLKSQIGCMVAQRMNDIALDLDKRRNELALQLQTEEVQLHEEMTLMFQANAENAQQQRLDWIHMERKKRDKAEAELLKEKKLQRERENSEEYRHMQTKQLLVETKKAQVYQIKERKDMRLKAARVECLWQQIHKKLDSRNEEDEQFERNLRQRIESDAQQMNLDREKELRTQQANKLLSEQRAYETAMLQAAEDDERCKEKALIKARTKKMEQHEQLQSQIKQNKLLARANALKNRQEDLGYNIREDAQIFSELQQKHTAKEYNRSSYQEYLQYVAMEREASLQCKRAVEQAFQGTGCVLSQEEKQPYGKEVR